jgi:hypothetical protein
VYDEQRNYDQIEKLWDEVHSLKSEIAKLHTNIEKLFVQLFGVDGNNGYASRIRDLEEGRDEMESRLANSCKDCGPAEIIKKHIEWHDKEHEEKRKERSEVLTTKRFIIGQMIVIVLYILSRVWKA